MLTPDYAASLGRLAADHLWQSTGFAAAAALLALALRGNHARVRHGLWLTASVKFLIPFSVLASLGGSIGHRLVPATPVSRLPQPMVKAMERAMEQIVQPLYTAPIMQTPRAPAASGLWPLLLLTLWLCGLVAVVLYGWVRWRRVAAAVRSSAPIAEGRELDALWRVLRRILLTNAQPLPRLVSSTAKLEPGAFGVFQPVLWLPEGIADRLNDAELEAILAHELCHIRRLDNLTAMIHMAVEAIFWFHPLVWWLGSRLTEERERACDEEVVRVGGEPQVYAESILKVCEFYLASPVACAAGVTGGELKQRIESIMANRFARNLSLGKKLLLAGAAAATVTGPFTFGIVRARAQTAPRPSIRVAGPLSPHTIFSPRMKSGGVLAAPQQPAAKAQTTAKQSFEVAMLRLEDPNTKVDYNRPDAPNQSNTFPTNRYTFYHTNLRSLIANAYGVGYQNIMGGPAWMDSQHYDISAKVEGDARLTMKQMQPMMQNLLKERVHLAVHSERRMVPGYRLVIAKGGSKLKQNTGAPFTGMDSGFEKKFQNASPALIAQLIEGEVKQPVVDKTGLAGTYDFHLMFTRADHPSDVPHADFGTIFTAIQEQLGLKLEPQKVLVDDLIIDHVERVPEAN